MEHFRHHEPSAATRRLYPRRARPHRLPPHDFPQYPPNYREYAYVTNGGSGTVTVLDVVNVRLDRELPVGQNPVAVAASPTRNEVYVVNSGAAGGQGSVSVINAENNTVAATIPVHRQPVSIDIDPAGDAGLRGQLRLQLHLRPRPQGPPRDRQHRRRRGAGRRPLSPDGKTLAVANRRGNSRQPDRSRQPAAVRAVFEGCPGAIDVVILPDSSKAFVACSAGHQVMAIALRPTPKSNPADPARPPGSPAGRRPGARPTGPQARRRRTLRLQLALRLHLRGLHHHRRCRRRLP